MEYAVFLGITVLVLVVFGVLGMRNEAVSRKEFLAKMRSSFGKMPSKKYTVDSFEHIPKYFENHPTPKAIDEITWNDLDLDQVYARINYCRSAAGEEVLYHLLHSPDIAFESGNEKEYRDNLEEKICFFGTHEEERLKCQLLFEEMRQITKYSVYDHLTTLKAHEAHTNLIHILMLAAIIISAFGCFFMFNPFFVITIGLVAVNVLSYYRSKNDVAPYLATFSYVLRLTSGAEDLKNLLKTDSFKCLFTKEIDGLEECIHTMKPFTRGAFLVMSQSSAASGNPLDLLFDYLKIVTHIDLIKFNSMYRQLSNQASTVDKLITLTGMTEVAVSIACLRASLGVSWCVPEFTTNTKLEIKDGYHPLLQSPVKDSITCEKNVLITGSNASGKSTFLKMCAINAIMAQTFNTVFAAKYSAPYYDIYSSMALSDDIRGGDSYYIVEIKSLKRILDAAATSERRILCFIDEVLRGTNTLERISASSQILKSFSRQNVQCFAATHDGELTYILDELYDNYHFDSEIKDNDILFTYKLIQGRSKTRNALQLLRLIGYDDTIVSDAEEMAAQFLETGEWKLK